MYLTLLKLLLATSLVAGSPSSKTFGALYSITNDPAGNRVVINAIGSDGKLTYSNSVATGGTGVHGLNAPGPDALFASGPVKVAGKHLFVVNAGSNTVSLFSINPTNPVDIKLVGKPVNSGGDFPMSVTISSKTGDACVLNGGTKNGVACFKVDPVQGLKPFGQFHSLSVNQTTPATGSGSLSHVLFSADGTKLHASVKGIPPSGIFGFVASWDVASSGALSSSFVKTSPTAKTGIAPFGMANVVGAKDAVIVTDPGLGMSVYDFSTTTPTLHPLNISGQVTTCWAEFSEATGTYFLTDLGGNSVYEVSIDKCLTPTLVNRWVLGTSNNPIDIAIGTVCGKQYLYILSPAVTSINVFSLEKGKSGPLANYNFGTASKDLTFTTDTADDLVGTALYVV